MTVGLLNKTFNFSGDPSEVLADWNESVRDGNCNGSLNGICILNGNMAQYWPFASLLTNVIDAFVMSVKISKAAKIVS